MVNRSEKRVFRDGGWRGLRCEEIVVGDIVRVEEDDECPADIVLVATGMPAGLCYIETCA